LEGVVTTAATREPESVVTDGLVSIPEACRFLSLSRASLYALMGRRALPFCKIGGSRRIPRKALVELAEQSLVAG
jgi:excisionase family DNA binding protein